MLYKDQPVYVSVSVVGGSCGGNVALKITPVVDTIECMYCLLLRADSALS